MNSSAPTKNRLTCSATVITGASVSITLWRTGWWPTRRTPCNTTIVRAGPDTNADAMKRGPSSAVRQNGRAVLAENKKAVTVWIEIAQNMTTTTSAK